MWATPFPYCDASTSYVALVNAGDAPASVLLDFSVLPGIGAGATRALRDLWAHADLGSATGTWQSPTIPPHGVIALKLTAA